MEGQDTGVNAEESVSAQHLNVAVLEVEDLVMSGSCGFGRLHGRFCVRRIRDGEVGKSGDATERRPDGRRPGGRFSIWGGD